MTHKTDMSGWSEPLRAAAERTGDFTPANRQVGELVLGATQENVKSSGGLHPWPELSAATLIARARGRSGRGRVFQFGHGAGAGPATLREDAIVRHAGKMPLWLRKKHGIDYAGAVTLTKQAREIVEGAKPLIFTGALYRSLVYAARRVFVDIGTNKVQAARLFFGSSPGVKPATPARNPFDFTPELWARVEAIYRDFAIGALLRGGR